MTMEQSIVVHFLDIAKFLIVYVIYAPIELHRVYYMLSITNDCVTWGKGVVPFLPYFGASAIFAIVRCELVLKGRIRPTSLCSNILLVWNWKQGVVRLPP